MTITKDFKGLQSAARSWFGEHDKGLAALENRTNGALYDALAALFNFHKEWSGKPEYAGLFEGSYIKDAGKGYADLIKLVFFAKSETASDYRANIAKWAGALMYLKKDTKDIRADLKKTGIAKLYNKYVAGKGSGGGTGSADKVTAAKKVLTARMPNCPTVNPSKINGGDIAKGYHLALVHVAGDKMSIIDTVADEEARDTQKYIKEFAPENKRTSKAKNAKFKPVYEAIRFADGLKVATHQRAIVIQNTLKEARILVGLTQEKRDGGVPMPSPVALMTMPYIKTLGVGTFILKQEEANGLKHLWSGARDWDWDFVKTAKKMDGESVPGYSIVLSNKEQTTADWKNEKTSDLKKAAKKNGKKAKAYEEKDYIGYMPNHMTIQLEKNLGKLEFAQVKSNASYDELGSFNVDFFLDHLKAEEFKPSHVYDFQADANGVIRLNDRDNNVSFETTEDFDSSSVKKEFHLKNADFVKALRSYKSTGIKSVVVSVSNDMVKFEAVDGGSTYLLALPQRSIHGYKTDEIEMVSNI